MRSVGSWVLPEGGDLRRWLEFVGPEDRDRLRQALTLFPEQPARRVTRRRSRDEHALGKTPGRLFAVPLFEFDADDGTAEVPGGDERAS